jgi:hypothetical protein
MYGQQDVTCSQWERVEINGKQGSTYEVYHVLLRSLCHRNENEATSGE